MRFALLGIDADTLLLVEQLANRGEHELTTAHVVGADRERLRGSLPKLQLADDWEALLTGEATDVVIVSRGDSPDARADQLRKLIQAGMPLVVSLPAHPSMLVCYELDMIRQETRAPILSYSAARFSDAFERLKSLVDEGPESKLGELEQVIIERSLADRSPDAVRSAFAHDMDLARPLVGELTRLSAMAPTAEPAGYATLGVQLSGPNGALVRWSIAPLEPLGLARLTIVGSRGRAIFSLGPEVAASRLEWATELNSGAEDFPPGDLAGRVVERLERLKRGEPVHPDWQDQCRAIELADSIQRSLEKGRTVELHYEDYTEAGTFKGAMTSLGCGLLWISCLVLIIGVILAGFRFPLADYWPHFLLSALGAFLLLQTLQFAFPPKPKS